MRGERDELARRKVLEALAAGKSVTAAAKAGGVARQTPYQWAERGDEEMGAALARDKPAGPATARVRLTKKELEAVEVLHELAVGGESEMCRIVAAKGFLEHHRKLREAVAPKAGPAAGGPQAEASPKRSREDLLKLIRGGEDGETG